MAVSEELADLIRRWRELQQRRKALAEEEERLVAALEAKVGVTGRVAVAATPDPPPAADPEEEAEEDEEGDEDPLQHWIRLYTPPQEMKPHEYVFDLVERFGVIEYGAVCHWMFDDGDTPANRKKVRNILSHLRDAGRINNIGHNHWKVRAVGERKR